MVELSEEDNKILNEFLGRVTLKGNEVQAFNYIVEKLNAEPTAPKKTEDKKED